MYYGSIRFPNIGIEFENVGKSINIFGFPIAYYGIIIGFAMLMGIFFAERQAKRTGQNVELYWDFALYAIPASVICARIYYVILEWDNYKHNLLQILNTRNGGLAIYGGILGAILSAIIYTKIKKIPFWLLADTGCIGLVVGQAIGRWGNFFNREAFGGYTDNLLAMQIKLTDVPYDSLNEKIINNIKVVNNIEYIQVHPTFLYESLWNICLLILLIIYTKHKKFDGEIILLYLLGYALGRVWIEALRTDQLIIQGTNLPASQVLAVIMIIVSVILLVIKRVRIKKNS